MICPVTARLIQTAASVAWIELRGIRGIVFVTSSPGSGTVCLHSGYLLLTDNVRRAGIDAGTISHMKKHVLYMNWGRIMVAGTVYRRALSTGKPESQHVLHNQDA